VCRLPLSCSLHVFAAAGDEPPQKVHQRGSWCPEQPASAGGWAVLLVHPGWAQQGGAVEAADSLQGLVVGYNVFVSLVVAAHGKAVECPQGVSRAVVWVFCGFVVVGLRAAAVYGDTVLPAYQFQLCTQRR